MNERALAERFGTETDDLLDAAGLIEPAPLPVEYRQALDLASRLRDIDHSGESRVRQTLRRQLLNQIDTRENSRRQFPMITDLREMNLTFYRRPLVLGGVTALLCALLVLVVGGPTAAAQGLQAIVLGTYSTAMHVESWVTGKAVPGNTWSINVFPGFRIGGNVPEGTHPIVQSETDLKQAQTLSGFPIHSPGYLPQGYALREIKVAPVLQGAEALLLPSKPTVALFYAGPGSDIVVVEAPVGQSTGHQNTASSTGVVVSTDGNLEQVSVKGHTAAWSDNRLLAWEADGISFTVGGLNLSLSQATRIAESLR